MTAAQLSPDARAAGRKLLHFNTDTNPPPTLGRVLWASRPQRKRSDARTLAELAIALCEAAQPKARAVKDGNGWRGIVYAGRRTRRETAKEGQTA